MNYWMGIAKLYLHTFLGYVHHRGLVIIQEEYWLIGEVDVADVDVDVDVDVCGYYNIDQIYKEI